MMVRYCCTDGHLDVRITSICRGVRRLSFAHRDRAVELLVSRTAEDITAEGKRTRAIRNQSHPRNLSGNDVRPYLQIRQIEAMRDIERADLEHHWHASLQHNFAWRVFEALHRHLDHPLLSMLRSLREKTRRVCNHADHAHRCGDQQSALVVLAQHDHPFAIGYSATVVWWPFVSTSISWKPNPRYGASASHATGRRLGTEPGAGNGNISDFAEW